MSPRTQVLWEFGFSYIFNQKCGCAPTIPIRPGTFFLRSNIHTGDVMLRFKVFFSQPTFHIILVSKLVCLIMFKLIHYAFTGIRLTSHWDLFYFITKRQNSSNFCSDSLVCCVLQQTVEGSNSVQDSWYGKSRSRLTCIKVHDDTLFGCAEV